MASRVSPLSSTRQRACNSSWMCVDGMGWKPPMMPPPRGGVRLLVAAPARRSLGFSAAMRGKARRVRNKTKMAPPRRDGRREKPGLILRRRLGVQGIPTRTVIRRTGWATTTRSGSLSLPGRRGEGWGEGLRAPALAAPPLIRPAATFSPPPRKGECAHRGVRLAFQRLASGMGLASASGPPLRCKSSMA